MKYLIIMTIVLLIVTKLMDVISTMTVVRKSHQETNPIARGLMGLMGVRKSAWMVFGFALLIITATGWMALSSTLVLQVAFVVVGIFISVVQAGVAACNWTGRDNAVSRNVRGFHGAIGSLFQKR